MTKEPKKLIVKDFYIRTEKTGKHKYDHVKFFKGSIHRNNIWIEEVYHKDAKPLEEGIYNFVFTHGTTYSYISDDLVNTHINFLKNGNINNEVKRTYIKTSWFERRKMNYIIRNTELHKNPVQFFLLAITAFGIIISGLFSYLDYDLQKEKSKVEPRVEQKTILRETKLIYRENPKQLYKDSVNKKN